MRAAWHTASVTNSLIFDTLRVAGGGAGSGVEKLRWVRPVYPGDELRVAIEVLAARASKSRPDAGVVTYRCVTLNQADEPVQEFTCTVLMPRRAPQCSRTGEGLGIRGELSPYSRAHPQSHQQAYDPFMSRERMNLHLVSDATGETLNAITRATTAQFEHVQITYHRWSLIRTRFQLHRVLEGIEIDPGPVLSTLVDKDRGTES